jgi:putative MFS transporter
MGISEMKANGLSFHHPVAFWIGCAAIVAGVLGHIPMFMMAADIHYRMAGMPMDLSMMVGMALIPTGLVLATYGLVPRLGRLRQSALSGPVPCFHAADGISLNRAHWTLVLVLLVALIVDIMKPATLGFVMPGLTAEYGITREKAGWLPLFALTGTTIGSIVWGRFADTFGRRAAILLSALMFIGTAICGAMPDFKGNLAMCFLMGASAGGLLPIVFTLMAETIPAAHRGWLLVALGGIGTSGGYLVAASAASLLEPHFSWRALWLLGLPTGALIIFLDRYIPESPRFLVVAGLEKEARAVLAKFSAQVDYDALPRATPPTAAVLNKTKAAHRLMSGVYAQITAGLVVCGVAWGLVNFGFLLWLPFNLVSMGMDASTASALLARSAILSLPGVALVIWMYHSWSSVKTLVMFIALTTFALLAFFVMGLTRTMSDAAMISATAVLLVSASGVIAMLIPYAAEIYPVYLRGSGSGAIAASSKFGGIIGAMFGIVGLFHNFTLSALIIAVPMAVSGIMLARSGIETRGQRLEDIEDLLVQGNAAALGSGSLS